MSARRYISPRSATTGTAAVWTLIRLSPEDEVYLVLAKENEGIFKNKAKKPSSQHINKHLSMLQVDMSLVYNL